MSKKKQVLWGAGVILPIIVAIALVKFFQVRSAIAEHANFAPPPESITSTQVSKQSWKKELKAVGSLASINGATLSTEVIGRIAKIKMESGQDVNVGDVLIELDTTVEEANLKEAQARLERARKKVQRYDQLKNTKAVSPEDIDSAEMELRQAAASADSQKSIIVRKNIVAPFSGRLGIRQVNVGQTVIPGTPIVPLYTLDPLFVNFSLPQQTLSAVNMGQTVSITVDSLPSERFSGKITALDPNISESTRNFSLQGTISNSSLKLRPGMFVSVTLELLTVDEQVVIPATSINYAPYGDMVYVIEDTVDKAGLTVKSVKQQMVSLGERRGDLIQIIKGLEVGQEVATSGVFKLRPGATVMIDNSFKPGNSLNPTPPDA